jgi:hypothetical protein
VVAFSCGVAQLLGIRLRDMSRRIYIAVAFLLAVLLTVVGWSQTLAHKVWPASHTAIWFPLIVIINPHDDVLMVLLSLIQFPVFAALFSFGIGRWRTAPVFGVLAGIYALLVGITFIIVSKL